MAHNPTWSKRHHDIFCNTRNLRPTQTCQWKHLSTLSPAQAKGVAPFSRSPSERPTKPFHQRMALEPSQALTMKQLSSAVEALNAVGHFVRPSSEPRAGRRRKANRKNYADFSGGAIAMLND